MNKCRLCLKNSKKTRCVFDTKNGISCAEMVTSITNTKISKDDGITDQICLSCRLKTKEFYNFKLQVERSYLALQESCCLKRINFNNICDIKLSIDSEEKDLKKPIKFQVTEKLIRQCEEPFNYNDIIIKKVQRDEQKPLTVIDFLNSIKEEVHNDYCDEYSYELEVDYDPDFKPNQQPQKKHRTKRKENDEVMVLPKPIQPIYLADYTLVIPKQTKRLKLKHDRKKTNKLHICPYCGKMVQSIKTHLVLVHADERPFQCDICSHAFVTLPHLEAHMKRSHAPRNMKCDLCVATFVNSHALKSHLKNVHSKEKKHICEVCSKPFKLKNHLTRHLQLHSLGAKPWKCEQCPDTFISKYGLKHHMRVHTGERPYRCEMCSQPYSYKHDFNRHCLKKHGVCFSRRSVHVMNEEVLLQERVLMRDLMLRLNGILQDDKPVNPFEGPQAALAFDHMIKAIQSGKVIVDLQL